MGVLVLVRVRGFKSHSVQNFAGRLLARMAYWSRALTAVLQNPPIANKIKGCLPLLCTMHGWPSGLRRQTQAFTCRELVVGVLVLVRVRGFKSHSVQSFAGRLLARMAEWSKALTAVLQNPSIANGIKGLQLIFCTMHGWPSGLRRQTQAFTCRELAVGRSGTRQGAWVQIPLRAKFCWATACTHGRVV